MTADFPRTTDALTPAWLSTVLGRTVTSYQSTFLEGGCCPMPSSSPPSPMTAHGGRPVLRGHQARHRVPDLRGFAHLSHAYQKECLFFQQLAPVVPIQVPKVYGCWTDGSARAEYFVLVLEDLPTHSRVFDQVTDPPDEACARQLVKEPNRFRGLYGAGLAAERAGDRDRARGYFEKLVALCAESDSTRPELVQVRQALAPR